MHLPFTDATAQDSWLTALGGAAVGFLSNFFIEWYKKRSKKEIETDVTEQISDAADKNVITTQRVIDILDARLANDREYFNGLLERVKKDYTEQIEKIKIEYGEQIEDLQAKVILGAKENATLREQVSNLTIDKNELQKEIEELKGRLEKYEKVGTGELRRRTDVG